MSFLVDAATALYRYTVVYLRSARKWQADAVAQVSLLHDKTSAHVALSAIEEADAHWVVVYAARNVVAPEDFGRLFSDGLNCTPEKDKVKAEGRFEEWSRSA